MQIILVIVFTVAVFVFVVWFAKNRKGTMTLYHASFLQQQRRGENLEECYRYALQSISHRSPISRLSVAEVDRIVAVFSKFPDSVHCADLLAHALKTKQKQFLAEPYLSRLEEAGRRKNLIK